MLSNSSTDYVIHDEGGSNVLRVTAAYSAANVRVREFGSHWLVEFFPGVAPTAPAGLAARIAAIGKAADGSPCVQRIELGGVAYTLPELVPINNTPPTITGPAFINIQRAQFGAPNITYVQAADAQGHAVSFSVVGVTGLGSNSNWSFSGNLLTTNYVNPGVSGATLVTVRASDGYASTDGLVRVNWISTVRP